MGVLEWKLLPFFKLLPGPVLTKRIHEEICDYCFNEAFRVFCDVRGGIYIYSANWECNFVQMFGRHKRLCALTETNLLITLEQKSSSEEQRLTSDVTLMVYNLNRITNRELIPIGSAQLKLTTPTECTLLRTLMLNNLLYIFIALKDGNIIYHEGHLVADMTANFHRITVCNSPIKGMDFCVRSADNVKIFICSENAIYFYNLSSLSNDGSKVLLGEFSASLDCCTTQLFCNNEQYYAVAHNDAIYCYTVDGKGPCYAIKGRKLMLAWYGKHLIVVLQPNNVKSESDNESILVQLVIIDIDYKIIVFNKPISSIQAILPDYFLYKFYIYLRHSKEIVMMREYDLEAKLRLLLKNNLYDIALRLVEGLDNSRVASLVYGKYGDHLIKRGDIGSAVEIYTRTVGILPPYKIIKQLMALRYNDYLLQYLKALEKTPYATSEHKELLQLCYERHKLTENTARIFQKDKQQQSQLEIDTVPSATANSPLQPFVDILFHRYGKTSTNSKSSNQYKLKDFLKKMSEAKIVEFLKKNGSFILMHHPGEFGELMPMLSLEVLMILTPIMLKNDESCLEFFQQLQTHHKEYLPHVCNIWLNILLRLWKNCALPSADVAAFIERHLNILSIEEVLMICRRYEFWHGIKYIYGNKHFANLNCNYIQTFDKCLKLDGNENSRLNDEIIKSCRMLYLYTLSRDLISLEDTLRFANDVLQTIMNVNPQMLLKTLECLASSQQFQSGHVNYLFADNVIQEHFDNGVLKQSVADMESNLSQDKELLTNYFQKPIEFRSTSCDLCKMPLKLPVVYYLCQHSFHKECIRSYMASNQNCVTCETAMKGKASQPSNAGDSGKNLYESKTQIVQMIVDMFAIKDSTKHHSN